MTDAAATASQVRQAVSERLDDFEALLVEMVSIDSARDAPEGIAQVQSVIADRLGSSVPGTDVVAVEKGGVPHLKLRVGRPGRPVVLLGHADTVFPHGTAAAHPYTRERQVARGPGVADMKGGLAMAILVIEELARIDDELPVEFIVVGDEETRIVPPPFADVIEGASAALVLECGRPGGGFVTGRSTGMWGKLVAEGRSAHAGVEPDRGNSAIVALCRGVIDLAAMHRTRPGLTVSVGMINGGSAPNVVANVAVAEFDVRSNSAPDLDEIRRRLADLTAADQALSFVETGTWPRMSPAGGRRLAETYRHLGDMMGTELAEVATGGMSDGCWTSNVGVPTVDGLGPEGGFDHSPEEFLDLSTAPIRAGLLAGLIASTATDQGEEERQ